VRHFAEDGYRGASQRAIQRDAGVNPASAHYYFGSKDALYRAVIETFIHDIQEERVRRHAAHREANKDLAALIHLLSDYFEPGIAVAATPRGFAYSRILAQVQAGVPGSAQSIFYEAVGKVRRLYLDSIQAFFPNTERDVLNRYLAMGVALMANEAVRLGAANADVAEQAPIAARDIASFVAAGFEARLGRVG